MMLRWRSLCGVVLVGALAIAGAGPAVALEIGKPVPDFTLPSTAGDKVSLSQFRGQKLVLLEFFGAAWAPT